MLSRNKVIAPEDWSRYIMPVLINFEIIIESRPADVYLESYINQRKALSFVSKNAFETSCVLMFFCAVRYSVVSISE